MMEKAKAMITAIATDFELKTVIKYADYIIDAIYKVGLLSAFNYYFI